MVSVKRMWIGKSLPANTSDYLYLLYLQHVPDLGCEEVVDQLIEPHHPS